MSSKKRHEVVGVDGCPAGWVAVTAQDGRFTALEHFPDIASLVDSHPEAAAFGIDIPLSFPSGTHHRATDLEAKKRLGTKAASLFPVPPREVLEKTPYAEANALSKARYGRGISRQAYALRGKILQAIGFLETTGDSRIHEVHPELSFKLLAESLGSAVAASKRTATGFAERFALLERVGLAPSFLVAADLGRAAPDDVLDASAAAWSAQRIAQGTAAVILSDDDLARNAQPGVHPWAIRA